MTTPIKGGHGASSNPRLADQLRSKQPDFIRKSIEPTDFGQFQGSTSAPLGASNYEFAPLALLRQGTREGWQPISYKRVADHYQYANPIASLMWADFARRCR